MGLTRVVLITAFLATVTGMPDPLSDVTAQIEKINNIQNFWKAGINEITSLNIQNIVPLLGWREPANPNNVKRKDVEPNKDIPDTFDARTKWSECPSISSIKDQGDCGSCWAVAAASCASDRLCIASNYETKTNLSAQNLLSCCFKCAPSGGCNGGYPIEAWKYIKDTGIVTGGDYKSDEGCQPYESRPTGLFGMSAPCRHNCTNANYKTSYDNDIHKGESSYTLRKNVAHIQTDILNNGPNEAAFTVYEDFQYYKSGVYVRTSNKNLGGHAVRILGWGTENGTPYWLAANSWNRTWGENGTFKIRRGTNECGFEASVTAGLIRK